MGEYSVIRLNAATVVAALFTPNPNEHVRAARRLRGWGLSGMPASNKTLQVVTRGSNSLFYFDDTPVPVAEALIIVWGHPLCADGLASNADVIRAVAEDNVEQLDGVFALFRINGEGLRILTTWWPLGVVREAVSGANKAWATRQGAAGAAAGLTLAVEPDAVADLVAFDFVMGSQELIKGVTLLAEGSVVATTQTSAKATQADLAALYQPDPRASATALRVLLGEVARQVGSLPAARLALTAGRDSNLLLSCFAEQNVRLPAFTLGHRELPDVLGAQRVAAQLAWPHERIVPLSYDGTPLATVLEGDRWIAANAAKAGSGRELFSVLVQAGYWSGGAAHPRDAIVGRVRWPEAEFLWLSGNGGEIGRAYYWQDPELPTNPVESLLRRSRHILSSPAVALLRDRLSVELGHVDNEDPGAQLDIFYVRNRMRKWLGHVPPDVGFGGLIPLYLRPDVVRLLLGLPMEERHSGQTFDQALDLSPVNTFKVAQGSPPSTWLRQRLTRLTSVGRSSPFPSDWPLLSAILAFLDKRGYRFRETMDDQWWKAAREEAHAKPWLRPPLWALVAAEAAASALDAP